MIEETRLHESIARIASTDDGADLYLYLQRRLMALTTTTESGALLKNEGERTFAAKLMGLMAEGIAERDRRTSSSTGSSGTSAERAIVFAAPKPRAVTGTRGAGRRVTLDTRVPGYDTDDSGAS